jgi:hypothetical protein
MAKQTRLIPFLITLACVLLSTLSLATASAQAGSVWLKACSGFFNPATNADVDGPVWGTTGTGAYGLANRCPQGGSLQIIGTNNAAAGESAQWHTLTPPTIGIVAAWTPLNEVLINPHLYADGYKASYFWQGGSQLISDSSNCCGGMDYGVGINRADLASSRYWGFSVSCYQNPCYAPLHELVDVRGIQLEGVDNTPPGVLALGSNNIWYQGNRWIRGSWPASFAASDDSGICGMQAVIDGGLVPGPSASPNQGSWTQCPTPQTMNMTVDTSRYPDGSLSLGLSARDAAAPANVSSPSETLQVDNQPVGLSLSGPADAPSTAGTQYVTATATSGPSGVGIACSVDGGPYAWNSGATDQVPVQGIGQHQVVCYAQNGAVNVYGAPATSPTQTWTLSIRQPTVMSATLARIVDPLRCSRHTEIVLVRAHWVTLRRHGKVVRRHGKVVRVRRRAHYKKVKVTKCHPRMVRRRERVHGHWRWVRVPVFPHLVNKTSERVGYGKSATVSGWLGMSDGTALGGQTVQILTAPNNGSGQFTQAAVTTTAANGFWTATIGPGPSRLIAAAYGGSPATEPTSSPDILVTVPAKLVVKIKPTRVRWGKRIVISGRILGGYIPANPQAVSQLLRLRIGVKGIHISQTAGIPDVNRAGRFRTSYCFSRGRGIVHFWFSVSTLLETDFPFQPASSGRIPVRVGPRTARHPC